MNLQRILLTAATFCAASLAQGQYIRPVTDVWPAAVPDATAPKASPVTQTGKDKVLRFDQVTNPTLEAFLPPADKKNGKAVIVCPGGAYNILAYDKEGQEIAQWLSGQGYAAYVLAYRVPRNRPGALQDAQRAIRFVRAQGYPTVGIIGFSAGASLSCRAATRWAQPSYEPQDATDRLSCRPDFGILIYPAYLDEGPEGTLTPELTVSAETPPLFVFGTEDDVRYSGPSCLTITDAMRRAGAPVELHYLPRGGHGYGMRTGVGLVWPKLAEEWLKSLE
ncbi:MAG: alpha/beta hydrolase [Bacteroidaceae bacterium]|nr:alpha/beta hydrolase [Bacteroidaceae bacterium]